MCVRGVVCVYVCVCVCVCVFRYDHPGLHGDPMHRRGGRDFGGDRPTSLSNYQLFIKSMTQDLKAKKRKVLSIVGYGVNGLGRAFLLTFFFYHH